uniref:non-specific serine/threonine protein kinase n=1 Tax=Araucaria cunninghamii TaxID=56994 RepID=A0A0D6QRB9_ARACU
MGGMRPVLAVLLVLHMLLIAQGNTSFVFNQFKTSTDLTLIENASFRSPVICLTGQSDPVFGRAIYPHPVRMKDKGSINTTSSFSTTFVFSIVPSSSNSVSGQGLAFIMTPHKSPMGAIASQFLGLVNFSSNGQPYNHLLAVEFDTIMDEEFQDINDNHVGVDLNNLTSVDSKSAGYWIGMNHFQDLHLISGQNIQAWIDYDHLQQQFNVTIALAGSPRPQKPLISVKNLSLEAIFEEKMYVGFSAATGVAVANHCILAWSFATNGVAPVLDTFHLPSLVHKISNSKSSTRQLTAGVTAASVLLLMVVFVAALVIWKRKRDTDFVEEWEVAYWPHRFNYKDLYIATKGFHDEHVLGCGGFGRVYKGVLPSNGLQVAVKSILRDTNKGVKEFVAEISSLGRLQHRNLVQLRGYCRRGAQLFIVYDYMPNGSLEKMIFGNPIRTLPWPQRYRILKDVASGLLYLHEEWEKVVLHRDIKSSNVLLDAELNAKLGDFGLARLYEHNENPRTTYVVGTPGYIPPELVHTGKATPYSDVYSFGILLLEVACGRKPVDPSLNEAQIVLVDWVRELHAEGKLMDAADPKLGCEFVEDDMERVLKLGMVCCNEEAEERVGMRHVVQILDDKAPLPDTSFPFSTEGNGSINSWMSSI